MCPNSDVGRGKFGVTSTIPRYSTNVSRIFTYLANGQPFKLLGITYLVGKIKFKLLFQGPLAK